MVLSPRKIWAPHPSRSHLPLLASGTVTPFFRACCSITLPTYRHGSPLFLSRLRNKHGTRNFATFLSLISRLAGSTRGKKDGTDAVSWGDIERLACSWFAEGGEGRSFGAFTGCFPFFRRFCNEAFPEHVHRLLSSFCVMIREKSPFSEVGRENKHKVFPFFRGRKLKRQLRETFFSLSSKLGVAREN